MSAQNTYRESALNTYRETEFSGNDSKVGSLSASHQGIPEFDKDLGGFWVQKEDPDLSNSNNHNASNSKGGTNANNDKNNTYSNFQFEDQHSRDNAIRNSQATNSRSAIRAVSEATTRLSATLDDDAVAAEFAKSIEFDNLANNRRSGERGGSGRVGGDRRSDGTFYTAYSENAKVLPESDEERHSTDENGNNFETATGSRSAVRAVSEATTRLSVNADDNAVAEAFSRSIEFDEYANNRRSGERGNDTYENVDYEPATGSRSAVRAVSEATTRLSANLDDNAVAAEFARSIEFDEYANNDPSRSRSSINGRGSVVENMQDQIANENNANNDRNEQNSQKRNPVRKLSDVLAPELQHTATRQSVHEKVVWKKDKTVVQKQYQQQQAASSISAPHRVSNARNSRRYKKSISPDLYKKHRNSTTPRKIPSHHSDSTSYSAEEHNSAPIANGNGTANGQILSPTESNYRPQGSFLYDKDGNPYEKFAVNARDAHSNYYDSKGNIFIDEKGYTYNNDDRRIYDQFGNPVGYFNHDDKAYVFGNKPSAIKAASILNGVYPERNPIRKMRFRDPYFTEDLQGILQCF